MNKTANAPFKIFILLIHTKQIICPAYNITEQVFYVLLLIISSIVLEINALNQKYIKNPYSKLNKSISDNLLYE